MLSRVSCLLYLNMYVKISKTVSGVITSNKAKVYPTSVALNICYIFHATSRTISTLSTRSLNNWQMKRGARRKNFPA